MVQQENLRCIRLLKTYGSTWEKMIWGKFHIITDIIGNINATITL